MQENHSGYPDADLLDGRYVDAHVHLDQYEEHAAARMLREFTARGGAAVVAVSTDGSSSAATYALARRYPGLVYPAYGFHPEQPLPAEEETDELIRWIRERAADGERFAIGEVGLPYYSRLEAAETGRPFDDKPYIRLLERYAELAAELDRPLILHAVYEDGGIACDIAERYGVKKVHFHWFKGDEATVDKMIAAGYYISVTPDVMYEPEIRELVRRYPLVRMMSETDGPWPFEGPYAGKETEPVMVADVVREIAFLKDEPEDRVRHILYKNAVSFYGL